MKVALLVLLCSWLIIAPAQSQIKQKIENILNGIKDEAKKSDILQDFLNNKGKNVLQNAKEKFEQELMKGVLKTALKNELSTDKNILLSSEDTAKLLPAFSHLISVLGNKKLTNEEKQKELDKILTESLPEPYKSQFIKNQEFNIEELLGNDNNFKVFSEKLIENLANGQMEDLKTFNPFGKLLGNNTENQALKNMMGSLFNHYSNTTIPSSSGSMDVNELLKALSSLNSTNNQPIPNIGDWSTMLKGFGNKGAVNEEEMKKIMSDPEAMKEIENLSKSLFGELLKSNNAVKNRFDDNGKVIEGKTESNGVSPLVWILVSTLVVVILAGLVCWRRSSRRKYSQTQLTNESGLFSN